METSSELKEIIRHPSMDLLPESEGHHRYEIFLRKFANIVNSRRNTKGITDEHVSKASGLSRQTVNSLRNQTRGKVPTLESAIRLLTTLGYEVQIKELPDNYKIHTKAKPH
jgi:DNA-binding XRE family transcriptional regulator